MIHEYALEPELVATWGNRQVGRYFVEKFGLGQPRMVSRYPKRWKGLVWDAFRSNNDVEKKRIEELLARLSERIVQRRGYIWEPRSRWLDNAHTEHGRIPFRAILAKENPTDHGGTLVAERLDDSTPLWRVPRAVTVARSAVEMADAVAAMLRIAQTVVFVDPHFGPERARYRRPLEAFLRILLDGRPVGLPSRLEFHTSLDDTGTRAFFQDECQRQLPRCIPKGLSLTILRLRQRPGGERLHDRYILTDVGGVKIDGGLDDGSEGESDDVMLMDRAQYELRWAQHASNSMAFQSPEGPVEVRPRG